MLIIIILQTAVWKRHAGKMKSSNRKWCDLASQIKTSSFQQLHCHKRVATACSYVSELVGFYNWHPPTPAPPTPTWGTSVSSWDQTGELSVVRQTCKPLHCGATSQTDIRETFSLFVVPVIGWALIMSILKVSINPSLIWTEGKMGSQQYLVK